MAEIVWPPKGTRTKPRTDEEDFAMRREWVHVRRAIRATREAAGGRLNDTDMATIATVALAQLYGCEGPPLPLEVDPAVAPSAEEVFDEYFFDP